MSRVRIVAFALALAACDGGGDPPIIRNCVVFANQNAKQSGITGDMSAPYRCNYTVNAQGAFIPFAAQLRAPSTWYLGKTVLMRIDNANAVTKWGPFPFDWADSPSCPNGCVNPVGGFNAATASIGSNVYRDDWHSTTDTPNGSALIQVQMQGVVASMGSIIGPTSLNAPYNATWSAFVDADTLSFQYRWYVNGTLAQNGGRSFTSAPYGESGTYTLMAVAELMDQTTDTSTKLLTVNMGAAWTGPTEIDAGTPGTWEAIGYAARYPLTSCTWEINYSWVQTGSCTLNHTFSTPQTSNEISVQITDARGLIATGSNSVYVRTAGCYPPDCYESMRVPGGKATKPNPKPSLLKNGAQESNP